MNRISTVALLALTFTYSSPSLARYGSSAIVEFVWPYFERHPWIFILFVIVGLAVFYWGGLKSIRDSKNELTALFAESEDAIERLVSRPILDNESESSKRYRKHLHRINKENQLRNQFQKLESIKSVKSSIRWSWAAMLFGAFLSIGGLVALIQGLWPSTDPDLVTMIGVLVCLGFGVAVIKGGTSPLDSVSQSFFTPKNKVESVEPVAPEDFYEQAWEELEKGTYPKGLWARLYTENDGNEEKTKVAFIKARVEQLKVE